MKITAKENANGKISGYYVDEFKATNFNESQKVANSLEEIMVGEVKAAQEKLDAATAKRHEASCALDEAEAAEESAEETLIATQARLFEFKYGNAPVLNPAIVTIPEFEFQIARFNEPANKYPNVNARKLANGKTVMTMKADIAQAVAILEQNFRDINFEFHCETYGDGNTVTYRYFSGTTPNGVTFLSLIEIFVNGKFDMARFVNLYSDQITDLKIGDANYLLDNYGEIIFEQLSKSNAEIFKFDELRRELKKLFPKKFDRLKMIDYLIHFVRRTKNLRVIEENPLF